MMLYIYYCTLRRGINSELGVVFAPPDVIVKVIVIFSIFYNPERLLFFHFVKYNQKQCNQYFQYAYETIFRDMELVEQSTYSQTRPCNQTLQP